MLKLTVKPGEYLMIGEDIKLVFAGGSANNLHILVDAPKSMNIARSKTLVKYGLATEEEAGRHYKDRGISDEAKARIGAILMEERQKAGAKTRQAAQ